MTTRLNYFETAPRAMEILLKQESYLKQQFKDKFKIWELVKLRISQINQCAYCIDMHSKDARKYGESAERIWGLSAWQDMKFYTPLERSALAWAELITSGEPVTEIHYQSAVETHGEQGLVDLTIAINAIHSWNRIAKTFKPEVGDYQSD